MNDKELAPMPAGDAGFAAVPADPPFWAESADASLFDEGAELAWLDENADAEPSPAGGFVSSARVVSGEALMRSALDDAVASQTMVNLEAARQLFAVGRAFEYARQDPSIYVPVGACEKDPRADEVDFAIRSVAFDLAQRLHLSENVIRSMAWQAEVLSSSLPGLKDLFVSGRISAQHVRAAVESCTGLPDEVAFEAYDRRMAAIVECVNPGVFARRCRLLRERLCADTLQERHEEARTKRRVVLEPDADAMAWLNIYAPVMDLARIEVALTAEARRLRTLPGETRTLDQLRADLAVRWLKGDGSATGTAGVQPFVLVDEAGWFAELLGYGPIPPKMAAAALRDAPAFRKVLANPVRPAVLNLDTTRYRPTPDQKTWLTLRFGLDEDAAPYLPAGIVTGAEVDHVIERQHGGPTNVTNLVPLKPRLHRLKTITRIRLDPKPGGGIRVRTPTGYDTDPPPF
ncbi:HNH endonuclease signature motif containing protein [Humibacter antri]